jgi:hypothetical protein
MHPRQGLSVQLLSFAAAFAIVSGLESPTPASGGVTALPLPDGFTITPEANRRLMEIGPDGTVYAIANRIDAPDRTAALRWNASLKRDLFVPVPQEYDAFELPAIDAIVPSGNTAYVTVARTHDGAYIGTRYSVNRWVGNRVEKWTAPACANLDYSGPHVYAAEGSRIALTADPSQDATGIDTDDPESVARNLPSAVLVQDGDCMTLGTAILTGLRNTSVVGFIGYHAGKPAPWAVNLIVQQIMAMRWLDGHEEVLGPGVPFAVTARGLAAGATALPGLERIRITTNFFGRAGTYVYATPHAVLWTVAGKRIALFRADARSVAWDVNEAGTVVGMMQDTAGRHHAFADVHGRVELLDDLPHPPGWRFEAACAVDADGTVIGIGTLNGIATAFVWRD